MKNKGGELTSQSIFASQLAEKFPHWSISQSKQGRIVELFGKSSAIPGITGIDKHTVETIADNVEEMLAGIIDFNQHGLSLSYTIPMGDKVLVIFKQEYNGVGVETTGLRALVNGQGRIVYLKSDLVDCLNKNTSPSFDNEKVTTFLPNDLSLTSKTGKEETARLVFFINDENIPILSYKNYTQDINRAKGYITYVNAMNGDILSKIDATMHPPEGGPILPPDTSEIILPPPTPVDPSFSGVYSGAWKDKVPGDPYQYGNLPAASFELEYWVPGDNEVEGYFAHTPVLFSDDDGFYQYTGSYGHDQFTIYSYIGNDISNTFHDPGDGNLVQIENISDVYYVEDGPDFIVDFDWTATQLFQDHPEYYGAMNVAYHVKAMHNWYSQWVGDVLSYNRFDVIAGGTGGSNGAYYEMGVIGVGTSSEFDAWVIHHETAHGIMDFSVVIPGLDGGMDTWWQEGQADYFASSSLDLSDCIACWLPFYDPDRCRIYTTDDTDGHLIGGIQASVWYDLRAQLGQAYVDSLVFFSSMIDIRTHGNTMRSILLLDDDDGDLANGTPNYELIRDEYADNYIGPDLPFVFIVSDASVCTFANGDRNAKTVETGALNTFTLLETYAWDSLTWDFGEGSGPVTQTYNDGFPGVEHIYDTCGDYYVTSRAYHTWGYREDTLIVYSRTAGGCTNYICGDVDNNRVLEESDMYYLHEYMFSGGPAPVPMEAGNVDCQPGIEIADLIWMTDYFNGGGPAPCACSENR